MIGCMFLKIFGDLCVYFSVVGAFPTLFAHRYSFIWPVMLCSGGVVLAFFLTESGKQNARFFAMLLPAASFLMAGCTVEWMILLPAVLDSVILIVRTDYVPEYYGFRQIFLRCMIFLGIFYLVTDLLVYVESVSRPDSMTIDPENVLCYGVLYALSGFVLLRQLRMGKNSQGKNKAVNDIQMAVVLAGTGFLTAGILLVERYLRKSAVSLLKLLWEAVGMCIGFLGWLIGLLLQGALTEYQEELETQVTTAPATPTFQDIEVVTGAVTAPEPVRQAGYPWWLAVLILAVMAGMLVFMMKILRSRSIHVSGKEILEQAAPPNCVKKESRRSNRSAVRRCYREFLKAERKRGVKLRTNQTSADILRTVSPEADYNAASELRDVYLAARYDETREITPENLKTAKNALKKYREGGNRMG